VLELLRPRRGRNGPKPDFDGGGEVVLKNSTEESVPRAKGEEGVEALRISLPPGELKKSRLLGAWWAGTLAPKYEEDVEFEVFLGLFSLVRSEGGIGGSPGPEINCMLAIEREEWLPDGARDRVGLDSGGEVSEPVEPVEFTVTALGRRVCWGEWAGLGILVWMDRGGGGIGDIMRLWRPFWRGAGEVMSWELTAVVATCEWPCKLLAGDAEDIDRILAPDDATGIMTGFVCPEWVELSEEELWLSRVRNSEILLGRSRLAAIVDTMLGSGLVAADSDASSEEAAAVTIEGAEAKEDAMGRAEGKGVGGTAGSRGALLMGKG
jgi:hypothetical protein